MIRVRSELRTTDRASSSADVATSHSDAMEALPARYYHICLQYDRPFDPVYVELILDPARNRGDVLGARVRSYQPR